MFFDQKVILSKDEVNELLSRCTNWEPSKLKYPGTDKPIVVKNRRISETHHMDVKKDDWFYKRLYDIFLDYNTEITADSFNVMFYRYYEGGFIYKHNDAFNGDDHRTVVSLLFLGGDFTGGEFLLYDDDNIPHTLEQIPGSIAIYRPEQFHEVKPVRSEVFSSSIYSQKRLSAN